MKGLVAANVLVFFAQSTLGRGFVDAFIFAPSLVFVRPWTLITYMFLHAGIGHLLMNMLGLFFLGAQVESKLGSRRFATLYFLSGLTGALLSFAFSPRGAILGASGGVFGVMLAFAYFWPRERLMIWGIIPVEARVLVVLYTGLSLFSGLGGGGVGGFGGNVAHFAHLGGFVGAWAYLRWLDANTGVRKFRAKTTPKVSNRELAKWKEIDTRGVHQLNKEELDRILDKVRDTGLTSLTPQERAFLMNFVPMDDRKPIVE